MSHWELFSSHGLVLIYFSRYPRARLRDAAEAIGLTERAVQNNIRDLAASGHLIIEKVGRRNRYKVVGRKHLTHATTRSVSLRQLLQLFKLDESVVSPKVEKPAKAKADIKTVKPVPATESNTVEPAVVKPVVTEPIVTEPIVTEPAIAEPPWNTADEIDQPVAEQAADVEQSNIPPVKKQAVIVSDDKAAKTSAKKTTKKKIKETDADDLPQQDLLF